MVHGSAAFFVRLERSANVYLSYKRVAALLSTMLSFQFVNLLQEANKRMFYMSSEVSDVSLQLLSPEADTSKQVDIANAYLDNPQKVLVQLTSELTLPYDPADIGVFDATTDQHLTVSSVDVPHSFHPVLVGDLQQLLGAQGDWNPADDATHLAMVNSNLYQLQGTLPAGSYNYKITFDGAWDGATPDHNLTLTVPEEGGTVTFSFVPYDSSGQRIYDSLNAPDAILPTSSAGVQIDLVAVMLVEAPDVSHSLHIALPGRHQHTIIPRHALDDAKYLYTGNDLGNAYSEHATSFRVWAPTASDVQLLLYDSETGPIHTIVGMHGSDAGTWYAHVPKDLENWYYLYLVTASGTTQTAVDPYATAVAVNAKRGMIVNPAHTHPLGWENDSYRQLTHPVDAVIYEVHTRDFSIAQNSGIEHKGKYLAFTEDGTIGPSDISTGIDSLKDLGITHVQIQPIADFASVDETLPNQYNWGYDPRNYNVPEGAYATTPHGVARITECKQMIQSLHRAGIGVVLDVVYNHTFASQISDFDKIVPQYYYRTNDAGYYTNGSGVGNELATERPMVQKFVLDSLAYWMREYHVDGFRFDLMALIGIDTISKASQSLRAINTSVLLYGEPWTGGGSALLDNQLLTRGRQRNIGVGIFNDTYRNGLSGGVFDAGTRGYAAGITSLIDIVKQGVMGSIDDFTAEPDETINYVSSHDNYAWWDKVVLSNPDASESERIKIDQLAQAIILTSQGVPFIHGGEEFLRTKEGNDNSYNAGDAINQFDWSRKAQYTDVFNYYAELIHLRTNHPALRLPSAASIRTHLTFINSPDGVVAFVIRDHANGDAWENTLVAYNPNHTDSVLELPTGNWNIVATQGQVGEETLSQVIGEVTLPAISCVILWQ
jgi:pullulanase